MAVTHISHTKDNKKILRRTLPALALFIVFCSIFTVLISSAYFLPPKNENDAASDTGVSPPPTEAPAPTPEPLIIQQPLEVCVPVWANIPFLYDSDVKVFEHGSYQGQGSMFISGCGQILDGYTWGDNIPETKAVDADYFSDAVFIGNSLEEGFMLYSKLSTPDYFATKSITVVNIYTEKVVNTGGGNYITIMDALSKRSYKKVYILLGLNEIGYETDEITRRFSGLIDDIRKIQPKAEIYLQSLTPVTKEQSSSGSIFNNNSIRKLNDTLKLLAAEKKIHFVYIFEALANSEGCLPSEASQDGIHPYSKYYMQWRDYLMTHTVTEAKK